MIQPEPDKSIDRQQVLQCLRKTMLAEASAIHDVADNIAESTADAVTILYECSGRVIVTGMGKMSAIARKCAATFCSTGTPAIFLHPSEAQHGDLGIVSENDVLLALSNSGETDEVNSLIPFMKRQNVPVIAITGSATSQLGQRADVVFPIPVENEADPISLAPTCSTTVCLAACDALAVALMKLRGFTSEQFAIYHPSGSLGRKLLLSVADLMHTGDRIPAVQIEDSLRDSIVEMSRKSLGAVLILNGQKLVGILTDGDLRRALEHETDPLKCSVESLMTRDPRTISEAALAAEALRLMEENSITVLPVVGNQGEPTGVLHLHQLVQAGLA